MRHTLTLTFKHEQYGDKCLRKEMKQNMCVQHFAVHFLQFFKFKPRKENTGYYYTS